jgi:hypothetical protein
MSKQPSENLRKAIAKSRTELTESSIHNYITNLRMLSKKCNQDQTKQLSSQFLKDFSKIKQCIDEITNNNTKKNRLTAVLVALHSDDTPDTKLIDKYQALLKQIMVKVNEQINSQEKTKTQQDNWIDFDTVKKILNTMLTDINDAGLWTKEKLSKTEYAMIQKYVLLRFYVANPIRNNVANCKVISQKEYDDLKDKTENYLIKDKSGTAGKSHYKFMLNNFKNVKRLGVKVLTIDTALSKILTRWLRINQSGYFFTLNDKVTPITSNHVTKLLNSIFKKYAEGKKLSTSMLRHIQISNDLKDEPTIKQKEQKEQKIEDKYQHSANMNDTYRKID